VFSLFRHGSLVFARVPFSGKRVQKYNLFLNYQNIFSKKIINKYLHIEKQHIENQKKFT